MIKTWKSFVCKKLSNSSTFHHQPATQNVPYFIAWVMENDLTTCSNLITYDFVYETLCSSGLLHSSTSFLERKLSSTKRRRNQYTEIDSLSQTNNDICSLENDEEVAGYESDSMENRGNCGAQTSRGWNSLRAVVRYYCSLRKIKRQWLKPFFILNFDGCTSRFEAKHRAQVIGKHNLQ